PASVLLDSFIDLMHQADGLGKSDDYVLVVGNLVSRKYAALPVLQPLLADLVATDVEVPHGFGHASEAYGPWHGALTLLLPGSVKPDGIARPLDPPDLRVLRPGIRGYRFV